MEKEKVLIVDDDPGIRQLVEVIVRKTGLEAIIASDGYQALEILEKNPQIVLVITDLNMPFMDGVTLFRNITRRFPHLKVTIMTSDFQLEKLEFLKGKPYAIVNKYELFTGIRKTLERYRDEKNKKDGYENSLGFETTI